MWLLTDGILYRHYFKGLRIQSREAKQPTKPYPSLSLARRIRVRNKVPKQAAGSPPGINSSELYETERVEVTSGTYM